MVCSVTSFIVWSEMLIPWVHSTTYNKQNKEFHTKNLPQNICPCTDKIPPNADGRHQTITHICVQTHGRFESSPRPLGSTKGRDWSPSRLNYSWRKRQHWYKVQQCSFFLLVTLLLLLYSKYYWWWWCFYIYTYVSGYFCSVLWEKH